MNHLKIITSPETRKFNQFVEKFDRLTEFRLDRSDPWAIVLECEQQAERAIDMERAAEWYYLAVEIFNAERAVNLRPGIDLRGLPCVNA